MISYLRFMSLDGFMPFSVPPYPFLQIQSHKMFEAQQLVYYKLTLFLHLYKTYDFIYENKINFNFTPLKLCLDKAINAFFGRFHYPFYTYNK